VLVRLISTSTISGFLSSLWFMKSSDCIVRLTSINVQKNILKNPVFKSTIFFLDVY